MSEIGFQGSFEVGLRGLGLGLEAVDETPNRRINLNPIDPLKGSRKGALGIP